MNTDWTTKQLDAKLTRLVDAGLSATECSRIMKMTLGQVNGRARRLKLKWKRRRASTVAGPPKPFKPRNPSRPDELVSFADLKPHNCRYPFGDPGRPGFGFCGRQRRPLSPYCPECTQVCSSGFY